jgi:SulP family sulfate permease
MKEYFSCLRSDLFASIVVFFVALPLCLGIALASGAPIFSGIIAGIIGGTVVGALSGSKFGVSGPAAGLITIVFGYLTVLNGSWEAFLLAVVLAGVIQLIFGFLRLGAIAYYFPSSVISGMLSGIGLIIIIKQIPHIFGYNSNIGQISVGVVLISFISFFVIIFWDLFLVHKNKIFRIIPSPLIAVVIGIILSTLYSKGFLPFTLQGDQLVTIPVASTIAGFFQDRKSVV